MSDATTKREEQLRALERNLASRGLGRWGGKPLEEAKLVFTLVEEVVQQCIEYRRELAVKAPSLLSPANLNALHQKLSKYVDGGLNSIRMWQSTRGSRGGGHIAASQEGERRAYALKARIKTKLEALRLEARLGLHQPQTQEGNTTIHISNSTIANLNLGTVLGDLKGSIQQLTTEGQNSLAESLRKFTEAVASSAEIEDPVRKELLEHLSVVSGEAAKPIAGRRIAPLRTSFEAVKSGVGLATQLLTLWQGVEHALKAAGVL